MLGKFVRFVAKMNHSSIHLIQLIGNMKKGGTSSVVYSIAMSLYSRGISTKIWTRQSFPFSKCYQLPKPIKTINTFSLIRELANKQCILVVHLLHQEIFIFFFTLIGWRKCKVILYRHLDDQYLSNKLLRLFVKTSSKQAFASVFVSRFVLDHYSAFNCGSARNRVIYNSLPLEVKNYSIFEPKHKPYAYFSNSNPLVCTFCGRPELSKGFDVFVNTAKLCLEKSLPIEFRHYGNINSINKDIEFLPNLSVMGFVENIEAIYNESDIIVIPSRIEGFCLTLIESWFFNKPALTSLASALPEVNGPGGFFFNGTSDDLLEKLFQVLKNPNLLQEYAYYGQQRLKNNFYDYRVDQLIDLIL